jgi:hypothetical protein
VVEERHAPFDRCRHRHLVAAHEQVVDQVALDIQRQHAVERAEADVEPANTESSGRTPSRL